MSNILLIERLKQLSNGSDTDLFEAVMLEENIIKKAALATAIISQILMSNGINRDITKSDLKDRPEYVTNILDSLPTSAQKEKAIELVGKVSTALKDTKKGSSKQVNSQISLIKSIADKDNINIDSLNYLVLDDAEDMMYHVVGDSIVKKMYVVTGAEKGDTLNVDDYIDWLTANKKMQIASALSSGDAALKQVVLNSEAEFFEYVGKKITPGGIYTLEANPTYNVFLKKIAYGEEMIKSQPQYYGDVGVIQPKDLTGKRQFWLIHGTGNKERLNAIASKSGKRNVSLGCVNVNKQDNEYLVDLVSSNPNMVIINLSDDGDSVLDIGDAAYKTLFGAEKKSETPTQQNTKDSTVYSMEAEFYDLVRKVNADDFVNKSVASDSPDLGIDDTTIGYNLEDILKDIRLDIDTYFSVKIFGNKDIPAMINILKLFPIQIRNKYVNSFKKIDPELANQLASKKYRDGVLSENFFKKIGSKISSLFKSKVEKIDKHEIELVGTLNKIGSALKKMYDEQGEISDEVRKKVNKKVEDVMEDLINQYESLVKTLTNNK